MSFWGPWPDSMDRRAKLYHQLCLEAGHKYVRQIPDVISLNSYEEKYKHRTSDCSLYTVVAEE